MLKEPVALATRRFTSPPRRNILSGNANTSPTKRPARNLGGAVESSKVLAALDALQISAEEDGSDIEILGPFPAASGVKGKSSVAAVKGKGKEKLELERLKPEASSTAKLNMGRKITSFFLRAPSSSASHASTSSSGTPVTSFTRPFESTARQIPDLKPRVVKNSKSLDVKRHATPNDVTFDDLLGQLYDTPRLPLVQPPIMPIEDMPEAAAEEVVDIPIPVEEKAIYSYKDYTPKPIIVYTRHEEEADDLIGTLKPGPVALDMEWRVFFVRVAGKSSATERRTAVVQVADGNGMILVIQVHGMGRFPKKLLELIENPEVPKLGVNILNDGKKLFRDFGILASNLVELGALAQVADPEGSNFGTRKRKIVSLAKLVDRYCNKTLLKGDERVGNWEAVLNDIQLAYAANDAHSSLMVYNKLLEIAKKNDVNIQDGAESYTNHVTMPSDAASLLPSSSTSSESYTDAQPTAIPMKPQHLRAYQYWHEREMTIENMCVELSLKSVLGYEATSKGGDDRLKPGTVISYIIGALHANPTLPYDKEKLRILIQTDAASWMRHREWVLQNWHSKTETSLTRRFRL